LTIIPVRIKQAAEEIARSVPGVVVALNELKVQAQARSSAMPPSPSKPTGLGFLVD
jgi:hypothetical protein